MGRFLIVLLLLAMFACGMAVYVLEDTIDHTATAVIEQQARTDPMKSLENYQGVPPRTTSPWLYVAVGALPLVIIIIILFYMSQSAEFLREKRLSKRRKNKRHSPNAPVQGPSPPPSLPAQPPRIPLPPRNNNEGGSTW